MKIFNLASLIATGFICTALNANADCTQEDMMNSFGISADRTLARIYVPHCEDGHSNSISWRPTNDGFIRFWYTNYPDKSVQCPQPNNPNPDDAKTLLKMSLTGDDNWKPDDYYMNQDGKVSIINILNEAIENAVNIDAKSITPHLMSPMPQTFNIEIDAAQGSGYCRICVKGNCYY